MENTKRRRSGRLGRLITAVFALAFVASIISTITAFAAANLFKIQNAELTELSATAEGTISSFSETNIVSNVTFHKLNDSAKYTITLKNTDSKDHVIESITDDNESPYISYIYDQHANERINAGENLVFEVTAKYTTAITDINQRAQTTNVRFFIHFTDLEEEIPIVPNTGVNPNTGDYIHFSVISLVISAAGLTIIGIIALKKHKKASKFVAAGIIAVAAIATTATVKAVTTEINSITLTTNYALNDRLIVTYTDKNGNEQELIVNYGEPVNIPDQSKDGYTLTGWEDENGNPVDPTQPITEDIKIHPAYRAHTYTIKFNGNGATSGEMTDLAMTFGEAKTLSANAFTWAGHEYTGWDTEANGSGAHYGDAAEVTDLTTEDNVVVVLYAQWSVNPFHIDYDGNGATSGEMATTNCEYDQACQLRDNAFEKYGYDFVGWKYNDTTYADKADVTNIINHGTITMQAQWTPHVYTITYTGLTSEEATTLRTAGNPDTYTIESPSFTLKNPEDRKDADGDTRERFVGWVEVIEPSTSVTLPMVGNLGNKTFNATWETVALPEYDITYNYDGGNVATANPTKLNKEQSATLNEPTKTGYTFTGWTGTTISGDTPVKPYTIPAPHQMGNLEYTAHYRKNNYTIAFAKGADDATGVTASIAAEYDTEYDLPASGFARTGYTQNGWKKGEEAIAADAKVKNLTAEDGATVTLTANWEANHYTIKFKKNAENVEGTINPINTTYDIDVALSCNGFTKEHYKLMGWANSSTGSVVYECDASVKNLTAEPNGEVTLYAVWLERTAMLNTGSYVNTALKVVNADATTFTHYTGTPELDAIENKRDIALTTSNFPVYVWNDNGTIYWWSEAEKPKMNANSGSMFNGTNFVSIDASGFDASTATNMQLMFIDTRNVENINISGWDTSNVTTMYAMFNRAGVNKEDPINVDLTELDVQNVLSFDQMFKETKFITLDLSSWDVESVTNTRSMFSSMPNLTTLNISGFDLSGLGSNKIALFDSNNPSVVSSSLRTSPTTVIADNVVFNENMSELFYNQVNLTEVSLDDVDTSRTTNMSKLFKDSTSLTSVDLRDTDFSNVEDMSEMFRHSSNLETVLFADDINTGKVTNMASMFNEAEKLSYADVSHFNTSNVTNMNGMFRFTPLLTTVDVSGFDTSKLEGSIESMFSKNGATELDLSTFDTSRVTIMRNLFLHNTAITTIYASDQFVTTLVPNVLDSTYGHNLFNNTPNLVGGAGTAYTSAKHTEYARIDDPCNGEPGFFTLKNSQYICFYANNGTDARKGQYVSTTASDQLEKNEFTHEGFRFLGWAESDDATAPLYTDEAAITLAYVGKEPKNLYAVWEPETLTITFDKNDTYAEGEMGTQTVTYAATETLNANTFTNYQHTFLGWNTQADGKGTHYDNHAEIEITIPHDFTLYAEWQAVLQSANGNSIDLTMLSADKANEDVQIDEDTKCKRAVQLHEEICESGHCTDLGYTETGSKGTNVVRYGSFGTQGGPLNSGDAFTCDVDGNGVFDEKYERFYYVSDYWNTKTREFEGDTAVLIYYRSTYLGQGTTNQATSSYLNPVTSGPAISNLPKSSLWQNVSLKNTKRNILAFREGEEMTITIEDFDYEGYSARLLTIPEAKAGCNVATIQGGGAETDSTCMYMYENSRFVINDMNKTESIGVPLENTYIGTTSSEDNYRWFIQSRSAAGFHPTSASTRVSMRPVIEVPKSKISY